MATATNDLPDWGAPEDPPRRKLWVMAILAGPFVVLFLLSIALSNAPAIAAGVLTVAWLTLIVVNQQRATYRSALKAGRATPLKDDRFENLVDGLASAYGSDRPELLVLEEGEPNALVIGGRKPRLAVTRSLLETFTRTEQEAVIAHCLARLSRGDLGIVQWAAALGRSGSRFAPKVGGQDDVQAAALTRYPPALAAAIRKAKPAEGPTAPFWFVAHDPSHRHPTERIALLQDL